MIHYEGTKGRRDGVMSCLMRHTAWCCGLTLLIALAAPARADVVKLVVHDMIHPISDEFIGRGLEYARQQHADAVLIELATPGGLVDSTRDIITKILGSDVPVIIYVAP